MSAGVEGEHEATFYVPVRSKPGVPTALFLEVAESQMKYGASMRLQRRFEGTLSTRMPGLARTVFREKGVQVTDPLWVLDVGHTPRETRDMGAAFTVMGGIEIGRAHV